MKARKRDAEVEDANRPDPEKRQVVGPENQASDPDFEILDPPENGDVENWDFWPRLRRSSGLNRDIEGME